MHLTIESKPLAKNLDFVNWVVKGQESLQNTVFENAMLFVAGGVLTIQVYDRVLGAAIRFGCRVKETGGILVPCETLLAQAKSGATVASEITLRSTEKLRLIVEAGKHSSRMLGTDVAAFPTEAFVPTKPLLEGSIEEWKRLLAPGFHCHDLKNPQFLLEGTQLICEGDRVIAESTDIRRISYTALSLPSANGEQWRVFLPHRFCEQVLRLLKMSEDTARATLGGTSQIYDFSVNGARVTTAHMVGKGGFPENGIGKMLNADPTDKVMVKRKDLELALGAVKPFADRGKEIDPRARLVYESGELSLCAVSTTRGDFAAAVDSTTSGCKPFQLNFNSSWLAEYLDAIGKIEQISILPIDGYPLIELRPGTGEEKGARHWILGQDR
jgi:DNA polymerase III sliding clamp (beta) subunit (PCNA family)